MEVVIDSKDQGKRIDKFVELKLQDIGFGQATRSMIKENIASGTKVNNQEGNPSYRVKIGDRVEIDNKYWREFFKKKDLSEEIIAQEGELDILYEDKYLIVLLKPKGVIVHPGVANKADTLANYIRHYLQSKNEFDINMDRAGIVHRLDKGVSGIMVVAKNKVVQEKLKGQFAKRQVEKVYLATVEKFKASELSTVKSKKLNEILKQIEKNEVEYTDWFKAEGYIGRDKRNRYKMMFKLYNFRGSKPAESYILPIKGDKLLIKIVTGRMHQIRATLNYYGFFIKGDTLYKLGNRGNSPNEIMLKSIYISFTHPITKEKMSFIQK